MNPSRNKIRLLLYFFLSFLLIGCSAGTIAVKNYTTIDVSNLRLYTWRGIGSIESGDEKSVDLSIVDTIEKRFEQVLSESGFKQVSREEAQIELAFHLQLQNALQIESHYRRQIEGVFQDNGPGVTSGQNNVLLPDVDSPLYAGQQRGTIILTVYAARTQQILKRGIATVIFPENPDDQKQVLHLNKTLHRLVSKVFQ